jgi:DNA-binding transcriptional ArsR family regulator
MAYVVIVCSRCRLARGAPESAKTASCPGCGRKLRVPELKKYHRTDSLTELAEAIGRLNASLKGGLLAYLGDLGEMAECNRKNHPQKGVLQASEVAAAPFAERPAMPSAKIDRAILAFLERKGPMATGEILEGLPQRSTLDHLEKRLEALRRAGLVFEPSAGRYAIVL